MIRYISEVVVSITNPEPDPREVPRGNLPAVLSALSFVRGRVEEGGYSTLVT